ncbi:MAG: type II toxin-antitoxin system RelE/ParE family toxin [Cohaesibacteraceae bacterium]|nr:type II toxin-antitoxin system RelE/ParE family toxin [Cohaesibacteraceae bacterium]
MARYKLSELARNDLLKIALFGDANFGLEQSDIYREMFKKRFMQLSEQPLLFPAVESIFPGYRRCVCGRHAIYYRISEDVVEIMRILGQQSLERLND